MYTYLHAAVILKINFQHSTMATPMGYFKDSGEAFGDRSNGYEYGWGCDLRADVRDRQNAGTRDSSLIIPDRLSKCANDEWNIELPDGRYTVEVGYSDPSYSTTTSGCKVEGLDASVGTVAQGAQQTKELIVDVADSKLTLSGSYNSGCTSFSFIHISTSTGTVVYVQMYSDMCRHLPNAYLCICTQNEGADTTPSM